MSSNFAQSGSRCGCGRTSRTQTPSSRSTAGGRDGAGVRQAEILLVQYQQDSLELSGVEAQAGERERMEKKLAEAEARAKAAAAAMLFML